MIFLETNRLILRNVSPKDAGIIFDYRNNELCSRYQRGQTTTPEGIKALTERRRFDTISADTSCMTAVALKDTDELIGEIIIKPDCRTFSFGYTFSYRHHRKGYAYEALSGLIQYLHGQYPQWDFVCFTDPENKASIGLLKKLGFHDMGFLPSIESRVFGKWTNSDTENRILKAQRDS